MPAVSPSHFSVMSAEVDASGVPTIKATVSSEAERQRLIDALSAKLGPDRFHANITVDPDTRPATWLDKLDGLFPVLTQPGAQVRIDGDRIELSGSAADSKLGWLDKLKALFGSSWTVSQADTQATPDASAAAAPVAAECDPAKFAGKLNLKPVNFRFGSNAVPQTALKELAKSAHELKDCATAATPMKLEIAGYSDNTGGKAVNLALSKQRAQAVRSFLIKHGVPASALVAQGYGDASPIADNKTAAGRLANRRIEFKEAR
jgi:outer membrane protein OmpA-like peptidoglycan-associated protein